MQRDASRQIGVQIGVADVGERPADGDQFVDVGFDLIMNVALDAARDGAAGDGDPCQQMRELHARSPFAVPIGL